MKIAADYDYKNGNGNFTAELDIIAKNARYAVAAKLIAADGICVSEAVVTDSKIDWNINSISPWSAEMPNLYTLIVRLLIKWKYN